MSRKVAFEAARQMIPMDNGKLEKVFAVRITEKLWSGIEQMSDEGRKAMVCEIRKVMARAVHMSQFREEDYL